MNNNSMNNSQNGMQKQSSTQSGMQKQSSTQQGCQGRQAQPDHALNPEKLPSSEEKAAVF